MSCPPVFSYLVWVVRTFGRVVRLPSRVCVVLSSNSWAPWPISRSDGTLVAARSALRDLPHMVFVNWGVVEVSHARGDHGYSHHGAAMPTIFAGWPARWRQQIHLGVLAATPVGIIDAGCFFAIKSVPFFGVSSVSSCVVVSCVLCSGVCKHDICCCGFKSRVVSVARRLLLIVVVHGLCPQGPFVSLGPSAVRLSLPSPLPFFFSSCRRWLVGSASSSFCFSSSALIFCLSTSRFP